MCKENLYKRYVLTYCQIMSFLSDELKRQIEARKTNALQLADKCGISSAQIYKWTNSAQTSISAEQLDALSNALSSDLVDHARLLVAHLQDERFGTARDMVRIEMNTLAEMNDRPRPTTKREKAIQFLSEQSVENRNVSDLVIDLARVLGADV